jgi:hypothetical protein
MAKRVVVCALLGGLAMFLWSSLIHMATPLGEAGVREIPRDREEAVLHAMRDGIAEEGLYLFPGFGLPPGAPRDEAAQKRWQERYLTLPHGVLVYHPPGGALDFPRLLGVEFLSDVLLAAVAAILLGRAKIRDYGQRVLLVSLMGVLPFLAIDVSLSNWYGFPLAYALASLVDQLGAFILAGFVLAWQMKP